MNPIIQFLNNLDTKKFHSITEIKAAMKECKLIFRGGESDIDLLEVFNKKRQPCVTYGLMPCVTTVWHGKPKTYSDMFEEKAMEIDKILRIDWDAYYGDVIPSIKFL